MKLSAADLERLQTLSVGQDADLKIDTGRRRVWLSRCDNTISVETFDGQRWNLHAENLVETVDPR